MIGILATFPKEGGGVYQYTQSLIISLVDHTDIDYLIIKTAENQLPQLRKNNFQTVNVKITIHGILNIIKKGFFLNFPFIRRFFYNYKDINVFDVNLIINPAISLEGLFLKKKYIITIHDFQHKYYPNFFTLKSRIMRNYIYKMAAKNASLVICESEFVKKDIIKFLKIREENIHVLASPPPIKLMEKNIDHKKMFFLKNKYQLPDKFLFYPAQFWYHKNHIRLIKAIYYLKQKYNEEVPLILIGSKKENFENSMRKIKDLNLTDLIKWLGFIPEDDVLNLYKLATCLIMPTFFESISIPIWEAFYMGCPVLSSNVCSLPEQVADAGIIFNPNNIEDIAENIHIIWNNENLRKKLVEKGYERIKHFTLENYARKWEVILKKFINSHYSSS